MSPQNELAIAQLMEGLEGQLHEVASDQPPEFKGGTRGQPVGTGEGLDLGEDELADLSREVFDMLAAFDASARPRLETEGEIESHYHMRPDAAHGAQASDSQVIASELLMSMVDQAKARLVENALGVEPLPRARPIIKEKSDVEVAKARTAVAEGVEQFLHAYSMHHVGLQRKLPLSIHRLCKVGTSVFHAEWRKKTSRSAYWTKEGQRRPEERSEDGVVVRMIPNRDVIVYPGTSPDWQEAELLGHREYLTLAKWRRWAREIELGAEKVKEIETGRTDRNDERVPNAGFEHLREQEAEEIDDALGRIQLTYLYLTWVGQDEDDRGRDLLVICHEETRSILKVYEVKDGTRRPYFPVRYKKDDENAWGTGIGHEVLYAQAADVAMRTLLLDNLAAGAYWFWQVRGGSLAEIVFDRPLPGQRMVVDEIDRDIKATAAGGKAEGLMEAMSDNRYRAQQASGLPPVLGGQGDPTLKSGGGTGSTVALIEQAGKKWGEVDRSIREDLSDLMEGIYELVHTHAPNGLFYQYASREDASLVETYFQPERGASARKMFRIAVEAPNATSSREARRHALMTWWQFVNQHVQLELQMAQQAMAQTPAAFQEYQTQAFELVSWVGRKIAAEQDLPDTEAHWPKPPAPDDLRVQQLEALQQQLQQAQQQAQQAQQQLQQMQQQAQGGGQPPPDAGGMPPEGMPPGAPPQPPPGGTGMPPPGVPM
jgi:hypothetical protein